MRERGLRMRESYKHERELSMREISVRERAKHDREGYARERELSMKDS